MISVVCLQTSLSLKVAVYDKDSSKDDWVDFLRLDLGKRPGDIGLGRWYTFNMTHRTAYVQHPTPTPFLMFE